MTTLSTHSELRRGKDTANSLFGNEASVLVGDFLYSRAFQMMTEIGIVRIMEVLANASNLIAEGEVLQLMNCNDPDTTEHRYLEVIRRKTAMLFEAGTRIAAILAGQSQPVEDGLAEYRPAAGRRLSAGGRRCWITRPTPMKWARTSATIWPRASRPCR